MRSPLGSTGSPQVRPGRSVERARRPARGSPRLLLVNPSTQELGWIKYFQLPPLALLHVAGATPEPWRVTLCDETLEKAPDGEGFDLVGITVMTHQAARAYELADGYRARGIPVVLGGIHPTVLPEEAQGHADAVVVGEAEPVWPGLLKDLLEGRLAPRYDAPQPSGDVLCIPRARRSVLDGKRYLTTQVLQASRGCPYDCPFCTVTPAFGRRFRYRELDDLLDEVRGLRDSLVIFLDDNLFGDMGRALPLVRGLGRFEKAWATQATLKFAEDLELLGAVARSGCLGIFVGVESVSGDGARLSKLRTRSSQVDLVRRVQDAGILVEASLIFGLDDHDESVFDEALKFVEACGPSGVTFHVLTPYPGTALFRQFREEGRLLHTDWRRYNHTEVVYRPKRMSPERLREGWLAARREAYSWRSIASRVGGNPHHRWANLGYNILRRGPNVEEAKSSTAAGVEEWT